MFSQALIKAARPATRRAFTTTTRIMAAGDTGSARSGGAAQGDAFNKREKANEDYSIRQREQEKLLELRKKLSDQHEHLKKLQDSIDEISKGQEEKK